MDVNSILKKIIDDKFKELQQYQKKGIFDKIVGFEGNAIGQIGEKFVKEIFEHCNIKIKNFADVIHDEYDICLDDNENIEKATKIEVKTARKGLKNNTFQFNGINPNYNIEYIICIGLCIDKAYFKIIDGKKQYNHKTRSFYLNVNEKNKKLVSMNPGNQANYKLTLNLSDLEPIENFIFKSMGLFG